MVLNVVGRPFRLRGEVLDLLRDDGETLACLAGLRRRGARGRDARTIAPDTTAQTPGGGSAVAGDQQ